MVSRVLRDAGRAKRVVPNASSWTYSALKVWSPTGGNDDAGMMRCRRPRSDLIRILRDHTPEIQDTGS